MRIALAFLLLGTVSLHPAVERAPDARGHTPPNIILIVIDDLGYGDLGCYGNAFHRTPHMDALAAQSARFTHAYANAPNCAPTRASLLTGLYSPAHGIYTVGPSARGKAEHRRIVPISNTTVLAEEHVTIAERLRGHGYATAHVGKWHLGDDPTTQGFDVNIGGTAAGHPASYFSPYGNPALADGPEGEYLTDRLTDEAISYIESPRDQPFFLHLAHFAVHTPVQAKPEMAASYHEALALDSEHLTPQEIRRRSNFAAMLESVDESVGRILAALRADGRGNDTVIIICSDNGGHARFSDNGNLRGSKGMLYEGGIRIPMLIHWPGRWDAQAIVEEPVITLDLVPTILAIAADEAGGHDALHGRSLVPVIDEAVAGTSVAQADAIPLFWHFPAYLEPYLPEQGRWRQTPAGAVRCGEWKLIEFFEDGHIELYHLIDDPAETTNLATTMPEKARELHDVMLAWRMAHSAPVPQELNPKFVEPGL